MGQRRGSESSQSSRSSHSSHRSPRCEQVDEQEHEREHEDEREYEEHTERTPLLRVASSHSPPAPRARAITAAGTFQTPLDDSVSYFPESDPQEGKRRKSTLIALILLCLLCLGFLVLGFMAPATIERYAKESVTLDVSSIAIESFTPDGLQARVKADVTVDAQRVKSRFVRTIGILGSSIAKKVSTAEGELHVFLPDYDNALLGNATVPPMIIDIRNGHTNVYNFVSEVRPVSLGSVRAVLDDYISGKLQSLRVLGETRLNMRSGILPLGNQLLSENFKFKRLPSLPEYNVTQVVFHEAENGMQIKMSATVPNPYPVHLDLPPLDFSVQLQDCGGGLVQLAFATISEVSVRPDTDINATVNGFVQSLPDALTGTCPDTDRSPIENFLDSYLHGNVSTVYVSGRGASKESEVPGWLLDFLKSITVPVPFPGHELGDLVESFGLSSVRIKLPRRDARPGTPEAVPKLSAIVNAIVAIPKDMDFSVDVEAIKANANLSYQGEKFGEMHVNDWVPANSHPTPEGKLEVKAEVIQAPLEITDYDVFQKVVQKLLWGGGRGLVLGIDGLADVQVKSTLGTLVVRNIPTKGDVKLKGFPGLNDFSPKATAMDILSTTKTSMTVAISLSFSNPTDYSATIPYLSVNLLSEEGYVLGNASVRDVELVPGLNSAVEVIAVYEPVGEDAINAGLRLLGEYVSGNDNATVLVKAHEGSVPSLPELGRAIGRAGPVKIPAPPLYTEPKPKPKPKKDQLRDVETGYHWGRGGKHHIPEPRPRPPPRHGRGTPGGNAPTPPSPTPAPGGGDSDGDPSTPRPHRFISAATMHIFSSTATVVSSNPFPRTAVSVTFINATALYNDTKLGLVLYEDPWVIAAGGETESPRMDVDWRLGSIAYDALVDALGGRLKIGVTADVGVGIGKWEGRVAVKGLGVAAEVRV